MTPAEAGLCSQLCWLLPAVIMESWNGWSGKDLKAHPGPPPAMGRTTFPSPRLLHAPSHLAWDTARDGEWSYPGAGPGRTSTRILHIPPPPSPCLSSAASLSAAPAASLSSSQLHTASRAPPADPSGTRQSAHPEQQPARNPKRSRLFRGFFSPQFLAAAEGSGALPWVAGPGRRRAGGSRYSHVEPGSAAPGIRNGRGRPGRAVPRSLVQLTAAAAFKFCSSCGRKQEAPELIARASRAHSPAHGLASLPRRWEWRFSRIRRKPGASRRRGPGRELVAVLGFILLVIFHLIRGEMNPRLPACPATRQHHPRNVG